MLTVAILAGGISGGQKRRVQFYIDLNVLPCVTFEINEISKQTAKPLLLQSMRPSRSPPGPQQYNHRSSCHRTPAKQYGHQFIKIPPDLLWVASPTLLQPPGVVCVVGRRRGAHSLSLPPIPIGMCRYWPGVHMQLISLLFFLHNILLALPVPFLPDFNIPCIRKAWAIHKS